MCFCAYIRIFMCMCMCICMYIYVYVYAHYKYICQCKICIHIRISMCICTCTCAQVHVRMCVCVCVLIPTLTRTPVNTKTIRKNMFFLLTYMYACIRTPFVSDHTLVTCIDAQMTSTLATRTDLVTVTSTDADIHACITSRNADTHACITRRHADIHACMPTYSYMSAFIRARTCLHSFVHVCIQIIGLFRRI